MLPKVRKELTKPAVGGCINWKNETDLTRYCDSRTEYSKSLNGKNGKGVNLIKKDTKEVI